MRTIFALLPLMAVTPATLASEQGAANPFAGTIYQSLAAIIVFLLVRHRAVAVEGGQGPLLLRQGQLTAALIVAAVGQ